MSQLRHFRHRYGFTQAELADLAGLALRTISGIEREEVRPLMSTRRRLALALGLGWPMRQSHEEFFGPMPAHGGGNQEETQ